MAKESKRADWERFWDKKQEVSAVYPSVTDVVQELVQVTDVKDKLILEVGAGTGRDSVRFSELGARVIVVDYADNSLHHCRWLRGRTCYLQSQPLSAECRVKPRHRAKLAEPLFPCSPLPL